MRILHTSDWHIGRRLYSRTRYDEFESFFKWLKDLIIEESVDILIVAGDVFDTTTPGNRAQEIYYNFLKEVNNTDCSHIVITGGNHDSPTFLNAPSNILKHLNIHVIGQACEKIEDEVFLLGNLKGEEVLICAVPYLRDRDLRNVEEGESSEDKEKKIIKGIRDHYSDLVCYGKSLNKNIPLIATGHLFTTGGKTFEDDGVRELYVGTIGHIGQEIFPESIDYLALGHLHIPQKVGGKDNFRYSGSPIAMGFGEANQKKKVIIADFENDKRSVREIDVPHFRKLKSIRGDLGKIEKEIIDLKNNKEKVWVEIIYQGKEIISDLRQRIDDYTKDSLIDVLRIKNKRIVEKIKENSNLDKSLDELSLFDVFERCLDGEGIEGEIREELILSYKEIVNQVNEEDRNAE